MYFSFSMFGLGLWLPELFSKIEHFQIEHPNETITIQELALLTKAKNVTCESSFKPSVIYNTISLAASAMAYNALSSWISIKVHSRTITMVSMFLGGIGAGCIFWMKTSLQILIVSCIFQATMVTSNMIIAGIGVELFPTRVNSIAVCFIMCCGRVGAALSNALFGWLMDKHCEIPIVIVAVIVLAGGALCVVVPRKEKCSKDVAPQMKVSVITENWKP